MIPLSRVLVRLRTADREAAETDVGGTPYTDNHKQPAAHGVRVSTPWNPTGNIFDLRPDLAHMPIPELAGALLEMRQLLLSPDSVIDRLQLMRFERQYSNALWHRASAENVDTITINDTAYDVLLTNGMDVVLRPVA